MKNCKQNNRQTGFTLVELVVVIVLLGLLAATALPRFLDVTDSAQVAVTEGVAGNFATAVMLVHAQWVAEGNSAPASVADATKIQIQMDGSSVFTNENGWPANTAAGSAGEDDQGADECQQVFNAILQNPPTSTTGPITNQSIAVTVVDGNPDICQYETVINGGTPGTHFFQYELTNGNVSITVP